MYAAACAWLSEAWVVIISPALSSSAFVEFRFFFDSGFSLSSASSSDSVFQENQKLKEQNDDLNGQILSLSLYEAKNLFATQTKAQSLAAEIDSASRDQVKDYVRPINTEVTVNQYL